MHEMRTCLWCKKPLSRRDGEAPSSFKLRKTCGRSCGASFRNATRKMPSRRYLFMRHVSIGVDGHWMWTGCTTHPRPDRVTYGRVAHEGRTTQAHRLSWILHRGPIQNGHIVRHLCGASLCVNPDHLATGTHKDNASDRDIDGRTVRGSKHHMAVLKSVAKAIYESTGACRDVAKRFNVCASTVSNIRNKRTWKCGFA